MEADVKPACEQMWLPGFEPKTVMQPDLPGFTGNDEIEPSVSDVEEAR